MPDYQQHERFGVHYLRPTSVCAVGTGPDDLRDHMREVERNAVSPHLFASWPGSGKTRGTTKLVQWLWDEHQKRCLYLMLSHDAMDEVEKRLREEGLAWAHWRGHDRACERTVVAEAGYEHGGSCTCDRQSDFKTPGPALAPIDYIVTDQKGDPPLRKGDIRLRLLGHG